MDVQREDMQRRDVTLVDIAREVRRCEQELEIAERQARGRRENLVAARRHLSEAMCMSDFLHGFAVVFGRQFQDGES